MAYAKDIYGNERGYRAPTAPTRTTAYTPTPIPAWVQQQINKSTAPKAPTVPKAPTQKYTPPKVVAPPPTPKPTTNNNYGGGSYNPQTGIVTNPNGSTETKFTYENGVPTNAGTGAALPQISQPGSLNNGISADSTQGQADLIAQLIAAMNQSQQQTSSYDPSAMMGTINNWGANLKSSLKSKIEAARQAGLNQYANAGTLATQQTASSLNQNAIEKANAIQQILQASEAAGQGRGGMNVSGQIAVNTRAQQNANEARTNLNNNLSAIEQAKAGVNTQADQQNIQADADVEAQVLQAILDAEKFGAGIDMQGRGLDLQNRQFNFSSDLQMKQFTSDQAWRDWQKQFEIENQAWQRDPGNPQMQSQVLANKAAILNNQMAALELQNYPEEQKLRLQKLRGDISQIGRAPAVSDYDRQINNIKLEQARIELNNVKQGQKTDYTPFINQLFIEPTSGTLDKAGLINYLQNLEGSGVPEAEIKAYAAKYGVSL